MKLEQFIRVSIRKGIASILLKSLDKQMLAQETPDLSIAQVNHIAQVANVDKIDLFISLSERRCRECGCVEENCIQCIKKTGKPCHWIGEDLCSACKK